MRTFLLTASAAIALWAAGCTFDEGPRPSSANPPAASTPDPTSTTAVLAFHSTGTRTNVSSVDAVLEAVELRDAQKLLALVHYFTLPCDPPGLGAVPCPPGRPVGTPATVVGSGGCEGGFALQGSEEPRRVVQNFLTAPPGAPAFDGRLYAVLKRPPFPREQRIPGEYLIVFASGHAIAADGQGITYFRFTCGPRAPTYFVSGPGDWVGQTLLLPPR